MKQHLAPLLTALACALLLSACGGRSGHSSPRNPTPPASSPSSPSPVQNGWSTAAPIGGTGSQAAPSVTLDDQGDALALWMTTVGLGNEIWSSRYTPGQGWSAPQQVDGGNGSADMTALPEQVVGNANGQALALWVQWVSTGATSGNYALWARPYAPASGWGTAVQLAASLGNDISSYSAGVDGQGNALVTWPQPAADGSGGTQIAVARYTGAWSPATLVQPGAGAVSGGTILNLYPQIAVTSSGAAALAWQQTNMSQSALWAASYSPASGWGSPTQAVADTPGTHDSGLPAIGMDAGGNITLAWGQLDTDASGGHAGVMAQRYLPGTGWQTAQAVGTAVNTSSALIPTPFLAVSEQGTAALVWSPPGGTALQASVASAGTWTAAHQLTAQLSTAGGAPQLGIDGSGNITVAWADGTTPTIYESRYAGGAWSTSTAQGGANSTWPALATNSTGTTVLLWQSASSTVQGSFYTPGP